MDSLTVVFLVRKLKVQIVRYLNSSCTLFILIVCKHISNWLQSRTIDLSSIADAIHDVDEQSNNSKDQQWVLNPIPIPMTPDAVKATIARRGFPTLGAFDPVKFTARQLETYTCSCGKEFNIDESTGYQAAIVYGTSTSVMLNVPFFACLNSNCTKKLVFDGLYHGFVAVRSSTYFDIELVLQMYHLLFLSAVTLTGVFLTISRQHAIFGSDFCSKTLFIDAVWSTVERVDQKVVEGFCCPHCGN